jgi:formylmethanofuran dehydrogenase subunit B
MTPGPFTAAERVIGAVTCLGCGCACDDIDVVVRGGAITDARNACTLGLAWFGDGCLPARVRVSGVDATLEAALGAAERLLTRSTRPLVYLAPDLSCEAQREGVAIADVLRAALDSTTSTGAMASVLAAQERGRASATLGQVKNFADVLVFWGVDPSLRYPRYLSRYAVEPSGLRTSEGRRSRTVIAVDIGGSRGPADADLRITLAGDDEVATLTALTANVSADGRRQPQDGPWALARELTPALLAGRYVTFVADAEAEVRFPDRDPGRSAALIAMTQALNARTRCALSLLRAGGNCSGADAVLTWQTGYPAAIDFARGYPRYRPYDGTALARLTRSDVDAALILGSSGLMPAEILAPLAQVPCAVIGPRASDGPLARCDVAIDTGVAGIHEGGTAIRMDDVPLPLRPSVDGFAAAADVARGLRQLVANARRAVPR